jgi:hypothetical protein
LPPSRSGIADYSALLLPELRSTSTSSSPDRRFRRSGADIRLYHVGNDAEAHGWIVEAREEPGVVVLHDSSHHRRRLTFSAATAGYPRR